MCFSKSQHRRVAVLISTFPACIKLLLLLVWCTIYNFADSYDIQMWHSRRRRMSFTSACKNSDPLLNTFRNNLEFVGKEVTLSSQKKNPLILYHGQTQSDFMDVSTHFYSAFQPTRNNYHLHKTLCMLHGRALFRCLFLSLFAMSSVARNQLSCMVKCCS